MILSSLKLVTGYYFYFRTFFPPNDNLNLRISEPILIQSICEVFDQKPDFISQKIKAQENIEFIFKNNLKF